MRIKVIAKPYSRTADIKRVGDNEYAVRIDAPAQGGKANERLTEILAGHFQVPKSAVRIVTGTTSREKVIEILGA